MNGEALAAAFRMYHKIIHEAWELLEAGDVAKAREFLKSVDVLGEPTTPPEELTDEECAEMADQVATQRREELEEAKVIVHDAQTKVLFESEMDL